MLLHLMLLHLNLTQNTQIIQRNMSTLKYTLRIGRFFKKAFYTRQDNWSTYLLQSDTLFLNCNSSNPFYQPALCNLISGCKIISSSRRLRSMSCFKPKASSSYSVRILPTVRNISSAAADSLSLTKDFSICSKAIPRSYKQHEKRKVQLSTTCQDSSVTKQENNPVKYWQKLFLVAQSEGMREREYFNNRQTISISMLTALPSSLCKSELKSPPSLTLQIVFYIYIIIATVDFFVHV